MPDQDEIDLALVKRVCAGDVEALGQLYDCYGKFVYSLARYIMHDASAAEDITQEVFLRVWQHAKSFNPERGRVRTWLLRIAHNLAINEIRRRRVSPVTAHEATLQYVQLSQADPDPQNDPAAALQLQAQGVLVQWALARLAEPQRRAIVMAFFEGLTQQEIAAALDVPVGTIKARIRMGMQRLREFLQEAYGQ